MRKFDKSKLKNPSSPQQQQSKSKGGKEPKKWVEDADVNKLDYSDMKPDLNGATSDLSAYQYVQKQDVGKSMGDLKPVEVPGDENLYEESDEELNNNNYNNNNNNAKGGKQQVKAGQSKPSKNGGLFSSLKSLVGAKVLTKESIEPVMEKMQEHLVC